MTVAAVSRRVGVSRTFLYSNPEARALLTDAIADIRARMAQDLGDRDTGQEATWRERALNAEDALKSAHAEIIQQRERIGELLGQVRDLEAEWTQDAIQRITTENTTLKQQVRQLTAENRTLEERLKAARSNLRFQDRRVADLEAQLLDPPRNSHATPRSGGPGRQDVDRSVRHLLAVTGTCPLAADHQRENEYDLGLHILRGRRKMPRLKLSAHPS